jgi:hypothetical protein
MPAVFCGAAVPVGGWLRTMAMLRAPAAHALVRIMPVLGASAPDDAPFAHCVARWCVDAPDTAGVSRHWHRSCFLRRRYYYFQK